jgi:hypothetical protein
MNITTFLTTQSLNCPDRRRPTNRCAERPNLMPTKATGVGESLGVLAQPDKDLAAGGGGLKTSAQSIAVIAAGHARRQAPPAQRRTCGFPAYGAGKAVAGRGSGGCSLRVAPFQCQGRSSVLIFSCPTHLR